MTNRDGFSILIGDRLLIGNAVDFFVIRCFLSNLYLNLIINASIDSNYTKLFSQVIFGIMENMPSFQMRIRVIKSIVWEFSIKLGLMLMLMPSYGVARS